MSEINCAIALSDLHLGNEKSYLNSRHPKFDNNKQALTQLLTRLDKRDELILNGDFLELALAGHNEVCKDVRAFFKSLGEIDLYKKIVFIPGNHDHHFWRELAEEVYVNGSIRQGQEPPSCDMFPSFFVDRRFSSLDSELPCHILLSSLWPDNGKERPAFIVKYPHHLAKINNRNGSARYYLFTHGHYLEGLFKPVNHLIRPHHLEELEAFNNIWLEAFDYHVGHAGRLSDRARKLEQAYQNGEKEAKKTIVETLDAICDNLKHTLRLKWWQNFLLKIGLRFLVKRIPIKENSGLFRVPIDEKLKESIAEYIETYVVQRYIKAKRKEYCIPSNKNIPTPFTFVFGHTHRPVSTEDMENTKIEIENISYPLANTGGWLRTDGNGHGENAGVLVIDQNGIQWESLAGELE